jgi:hypothetical protein
MVGSEAQGTKYHVEMDFMKVGLNHLREKQRGLHLQVQYNCQCQVCKGEIEGACHAHEAIYKSMTLTWESCVCPKGELDVWHKLECLMGECSHCGFQLFPLVENEAKNDWKNDCDLSRIGQE